MSNNSENAKLSNSICNVLSATGEKRLPVLYDRQIHSGWSKWWPAKSCGLTERNKTG